MHAFKCTFKMCCCTRHRPIKTAMVNIYVLWGHLDGNAQSITFPSRSLSTNLACPLTRHACVFNEGRRRLELL